MLRIATAIPATTDVAQGVAAVVNSLILEAPVSIGWDGKWVPKVVESAEWSPDGLTLRLRLGRKILFHDGTALTNALAADIIKKALAPARRALSTSVVSVARDGDSDIVIHTRQPEGFLLSDISTANFSLPDQPQIGTGPFMLESSAGDTTTLRAFPGYHQGTPGFAGIKVTQYATQRQAYAALLRNEADVLYEVSSELLDFVSRETMLQARSFMRAYYHALAFNLRLPVFAKRGVRRALNEAVDRQRLVEPVSLKLGIAAGGPVWPHHFAHSSEESPLTYNPARARRLLDAEGLKERPAALPGRMPSRFHFTCIAPKEDLRIQQIAGLVQKDLFNIGVDMEVELLSFAELDKRLSSGRFEAVLLPFTASRSLSFVYAFWRSPTKGAAARLNVPYTSADDPLDRLRAALTEQDIRSAVKDVQRAIHDEPPAIFLNWMESTRVLTKAIEVPKEDEGLDVFRSVWKWQPARTDKPAK